VGDEKLRVNRVENSTGWSAMHMLHVVKRRNQAKKRSAHRPP
jgi:hypothetical protein